MRALSGTSSTLDLTCFRPLNSLKRFVRQCLKKDVNDILEPDVVFRMHSQEWPIKN